jgi:type I restriction enzyme S subunit
MASDLYITSYTQTYSEVGLQQSKMWDKNTLCMTIAGENTGEVALLGFKACFPDSVIAFVPDPAKADGRFVKYYFDTMKGRIKSISRGATQDNLSLDKLLSLDLRVPALPLQRRIADILSSYDNLIENNTRRIKILEGMAKMLYREWFVSFRFPGHENVRMVESELGPIPEGWSVGTVSQMAILHREGINPANFPNEVFLHFSIPSFDNNRTPVREKGIEIKSNKYRVVPGCVLLSKLNPRIPRLWMPSVGNGVREITSTEFLVLTPPVAAHKSYLFQFFSSEEFSGSLSGRSLGTSTSHQRVKPDDFLNLPSILPARSVMDEFCLYVDPIMEETSLLRSKNNNLRTTRDFLLPKLISGEISVEAADEEAAELVEQTA